MKYTKMLYHAAQKYMKYYIKVLYIISSIILHNHHLSSLVENNY